MRKIEHIGIAVKDLEVSNYLGMDCNVGTVTNKITNMYDVISRYPSNSNENSVLSYRIVCGQQYQQDTIDSLKGVVCSPMPKYWYSIKDCYKYIEENNFSEEEKQVLLNCVASKKPLVQSNNLMNSIHYQISGNLLLVGSNLIYAATHQFGATIKAKNAKSLSWKIGDQSIFVKQVVIPAREYLGISLADETELYAIAEDHLLS